MSASSTSYSLPSSSSTMTSYSLMPGPSMRPPQFDGERILEHAKFTFPTIFIIVISVILFFVFMYFYLSPIIRDPSVVAPNSSQRLREKDKEWPRRSPLGDLEKVLPRTPDQHERQRGLLSWFCRGWWPASHIDRSHTLRCARSRGFSLFSSPSSAGLTSTSTSFTVPLPSPVYFSNPSAATGFDSGSFEYRLPSPPEVPVHGLKLHQRHARPPPPAVSRPVVPRHTSLYSYIRRTTPVTSGERSPNPSPLSNVLCKRESSSTIDSLGRSAPLEQYMLMADDSNALSSGSTSPLTSSSGKMSPAGSVHSMLCR